MARRAPVAEFLGREEATYSEPRLWQKLSRSALAAFAMARSSASVISEKSHSSSVSQRAVRRAKSGVACGSSSTAPRAHQ